MDPLVTHVAGQLARAALPGDAPVMVACSGGPDSMVLAHIAQTLAAAGSLGPVTLAYIDHGLRPGAADDGDRVARLAAATGAAYVKERVTVAAGASLEAAARRARYAALENLADRIGAAAILVGHTANDQAETVLMRICRGTGITGLGAMALRRGRIVRPLLDIDRRAIAAYARRHHLDPARDPMNDDPRFSRVRWRAQWIPALEAENPNLVRALCRLADSAKEPRAVLDFAATQLLHTARDDDGLAIAGLVAAPRPVLSRALAMAAETAGGGPLSHRHITALIALITAPEAGSRSLDLPGLCATRIYHRLHLAPPAPPATAWPWSVAGEAQNAYRARRFRPGDRMRPARLGGRSRKLSDLFIDLKVPRARRQHAVILERADDGAIAWAEHIGAAWEQPIEVTLTPPYVVVSNKG